MKVRELISVLKNMPKDSLVFLQDPESKLCYEVHEAIDDGEDFKSVTLITKDLDWDSELEDEE